MPFQWTIKLMMRIRWGEDMKVGAAATFQPFVQHLGWSKEEHTVLAAKCASEIDDYKNHHVWLDM
jgi:hypothetical protein